MRLLLSSSVLCLSLLAACGSEPEERQDATLNQALPSPSYETINETEEQTAPEAPDGTPPRAPAAPSARVEDPGTIPAAFQGRWTGVAQGCDDPRSDLRLAVGGNTLRFYESEGVVTDVAQSGARAVTVNARYTGEGETWERRQTLTLSAAGDRLTIADDGAATVRKRCPGGG